MASRSRGIGRFKDDQSGGVPAAHAPSHENGGADEIDVTGLSGDLADPQDPKAHATTHENGGGDEINVGGLSGLLADGQTPLAHAASHAEGGSDELDVANLGSASAPAGAPHIPVSDGSGGVDWLCRTPFSLLGGEFLTVDENDLVTTAKPLTADTSDFEMVNDQGEPIFGGGALGRPITGTELLDIGLDRSDNTVIVGSPSGGDLAQDVDFYDTLGDGQAIVDAVAALNAKGGGSLLIRQGTYDFSLGTADSTLPLTLEFGGRVVGVGPATRIISSPLNRTVFWIGGAAGSAGIFRDFQIVSVAAVPGATGTELLRCASSSGLIQNIFFDSIGATTVDESITSIIHMSSTYGSISGCVGFPTVPVSNSGNSAQATGSIQCIAQSLMNDGETLTMSDGRNAATVFEFDVSGTHTPTGSNIEIDISGDTTADDVATTVRAAIQARGDLLRITPAAPVAGLLSLTALHKSASANVTITDTVADVTFTTTGMSGGASTPLTLLKVVGNASVTNNLVIFMDALLNGAGLSTVSGNLLYITPFSPITVTQNCSVLSNVALILSQDDTGAGVVNSTANNNQFVANNLQCNGLVTFGNVGASNLNNIYIGNSHVNSFGTGIALFKGQACTVVGNNFTVTSGKAIDDRSGQKNHLIRLNKGQAEHYPGGVKGGIPIAKVTTSPYNMTTFDGLVSCDCTSGAITVNLPSPTLKDEFFCHISKTDATANAVTIAPNAGETINGPTTLNTQFQSISYVTDGTDWFVF